MRCISCLYVIQRLLLLCAVVVICYFIISLTSRPVQHFKLDLSTSIPSSEWSSRGEPYIDPGSLVDSPLMSHSVNEQLRVAMYKRLSSKLARYAHRHRSTPPADVNNSHRVSNQDSVQLYHSRIVKDIITSRDERVVTPNTEKSPRKAGVSSRGNTATLAIEQLTANPSHVGTQSPHHLSTVGTPFTLSHNYHWPQPRAVRAVTDLSTEQWVTDLQSCLKIVTSHEVTLLTSNQPYTEVMENRHIHNMDYYLVI